MNSSASMLRGASCALGTALVLAAGAARAETPDQPSWDAKAAAAYLDGRAAWWMDWPSAARDHGTFCVSCHTAMPYAISRPALRAALGESARTPTESRLTENVAKRVREWRDVE